jgi:hypothetical protein
VSSTGHHIRPPASTEGPDSRRHTCTVKRWRGYVTHTFYAELEGGGLIVESRPFRDRERAGEPSAAARERHQELLVALEEAGWELAGESGPEWYQATLHRPLEAWELEAELPVPDAPPPRVEAPARPEPPVRPVARLTPQAAVRAAPAPPKKTAPAPRPQPEKARAGKRRRRKTATAAAALAALGTAGGIALLTAGASRPQSAPARPAVEQKAPPSTPVAAKTTTPPPTSKPRRTVSKAPARPQVHVTIAAPSRASWLEVRRSTAHGKVVFSGELSAGHRLRLKGTRLWARFGAAGNLSISVNGRPLRLQGTYEHVFVARPASR